MRRKRRLSLRLAVLLASLAFAAVFSAPAWAETRTALIIGNAAYKTAPLRNPVNDARDMAQALRGLGFDVILKTDATHKEMEASVREFGLKLRKGGVGLFYFAGHGLQVGGENYLVPVDAQIQSEADVRFGCLNAGLVLGKMEDAGNAVNLVVLDACRNNPFGRSFRSAETGLAKMDAPKGSLIAYATAPGRVAEDGSGKNGVYTKHLLENIGKPGLSLGDVFMRTRIGVLSETRERQVPWESSSLTGYIYLSGQQQASVAPGPKAQPAAPAQAPAPVPAAGPAQPALAAARPQLAPAPTPDEAKLMQAMRLAWSAKHDEERELVRKLARPLSAKGSIFGSFAQGWLSEDDKVRHQAIIQAANQGIPLGMVDLAEYLVENPVSTEDEVEARAWLRKALELGEPRAKVGLGSLLIQGKGGPRDVAAGERLLAEAAREFPEFNLLVGSAYSELADKGLPKAEAKAKALSYIRRGADLGDVHAMMQLGNEHQFGWSVPVDEKEAVWWFTRAADKGSPHAMFYLASLLRSGGKNLPKDPISAARWFRKAADLGDELSILLLAEMTIAGEGVPQDQQRGLAVFRGLADSGSGVAQVWLGKLYRHGFGMPKGFKDVSEAYFWFVLADAGGDVEGRVWRESTAKELPAEVRAKIEARAAKWKPKKTK